MKLTFRAIQEQILDSITEKGTIVYTNEKNMYIVKSDGTKMKVSDNIFVEDETVMNDLPEKFLDKIYITKNNWRMYTWDGTVFKLLSGGGGSGSGGISETQRETITVTDGLTTLKVPFSFPVGGNLKVYKNGVLLDLDKDYTENASGTIELVVPTVSTDLFTFMLELAGVVRLEPTSYQLSLEYNPDGSVAKEIYTGGVEKTITFEYDSEGNVTRQFVLRDGQTFVTTYNYDSQGNITSVVDEGSQIAVLTAGDGTLQGIKPIAYTLTLVYNPDGSVGKEVYTGDIQKTITYFYTPEGNVDYKEVLESDGSIRKAVYNYVDGRLESIVDEGTELVIVEGSTSTGGGTSYDDTALVERIETIEQNTKKPFIQTDIKGQLVGSTSLKDDVVFMSESINDLIDYQEETQIRQVNKLGVFASQDTPKEISIPIPETVDFRRQPIEVLKFIPASDNVMSTEIDFTEIDSHNFNSDDKIIFNGSIIPKTTYTKDMTNEGIIGSGSRFSVEINKLEFNKIESLGVK